MKDPRFTSRWRKVKQQAKLRDMRRGARCHICGDLIDYHAEPMTPYAYEADHYPMSVQQMIAAGHPEWAYDLTNLKPAHCSCNRSAGSKLSESTSTDIGKPTRSI